MSLGSLSRGEAQLPCSSSSRAAFSVFCLVCSSTVSRTISQHFCQGIFMTSKALWQAGIFSVGLNTVWHWHFSRTFIVAFRSRAVRAVSWSIGAGHLCPSRSFCFALWPSVSIENSSFTVFFTSLVFSTSCSTAYSFRLCKML